MNEKMNFSVELGVLHEEISSLRAEIRAMREILQPTQLSDTEINQHKQEIPILNHNLNNLDTVIFDFLLTYQFAVHLKGFRYLKEAIKMEITDRSLLDGITKVVYPVIANKYNDAPNRVERAIRHAIENAWYKSKHPDLVQRMVDKPTNSEFIALAAEKIRLVEVNTA
ncbi:MAG: chemotaxis protein CheY [Neobacillus sp.]|nr:chemotaxis protein CheY [Neobacillus sp.]